MQIENVLQLASYAELLAISGSVYRGEIKVTAEESAWITRRLRQLEHQQQVKVSVLV